MKVKLLAAVVLAVIGVLVFATVAYAAVSEETILAILDDAKDLTIDGDWTAAEIQAALDYIQDNPTYQQYSQYEGVLEDYLASLNAPGEEEGELAFTGGEILMLLGAGAGLAGSGALLRRRRP
jgi:hypothetical protein